MDSVGTGIMKKVELNKERKKNDLLNAAYKLFTTIGFAETTITQIASKAKVGKGTFYLYFKSKEDINRALIANKSGQLLQQAIDELEKYCQNSSEAPSITDKFIFLTDYIVTAFSEDLALLRYISKHLSRGMFSLPLDDTVQHSEWVDFRAYLLDMLEQDGQTVKNFDLMIFTIIELINSTCYNVILHGQPVTFSDYKPYLFNCVRLIVNDALEDPQ